MLDIKNKTNPNLDFTAFNIIQMCKADKDVSQITYSCLRCFYQILTQGSEYFRNITTIEDDSFLISVQAQSHHKLSLCFFTALV